MRSDGRRFENRGGFRGERFRGEGFRGRGFRGGYVAPYVAPYYGYDSYVAPYPVYDGYADPYAYDEYDAYAPGYVAPYVAPRVYPRYGYRPRLNIRIPLPPLPRLHIRIGR